MAQSAYTLTSFSNTFTRPANTTPYVANTIISNGSILVLPIPDRPFFLRRLQVNTSVSNPSHTFRIYFFTSDPTGGSFVVADSGTPNFTGLFNTYEGFLDISLNSTTGLNTGDINNNASFVLPSTPTGTLFLLCETRTAFTPVSATVYRVKAYTETAN